MTERKEEKKVCRMDDEGNRRSVLLFDALNRIDRRNIYHFCVEINRQDAEEFLLHKALERQNELHLAARGSDEHKPIADETLHQLLKELDHPSLF